MDKAARAVRRSSVKLLSLGGGHADLHVLLSEVKDMRNTAKAFMNAQNTVSQDFLKWAVNEENRAVQDVANQLAELNLLWTEIQREFGEHLKEYRHMFDMILEGEKHVAQSKNNFAACEQREIKARKELKKAFKRASSSEIQSLEGRLSQAERAKDLAQIEVADRIRENEAVKLIRLKEGLTKLSQAYSDFARKCAVVFDAQQDIVQQLPDVLDQDLEDMKYTGSGATRYRVQQAKEKVHNFRRGRDVKSALPKYNEPPPPYSVVEDMSPNTSAVNPSPRNMSPRRRLSSALDSSQGSSGLDNSVLPPPPSSSSSLGSPAPAPSSMYPSPPSSSYPLNPGPPLRPPAPVAAPEGPADSITLPVQPTSSDDDIHIPAVPRVASPSPHPHPPPHIHPHILTELQRQDLADLVDFDPNWDHCYEDDLSGAMGGLKM
ncbi:arp2/3 complex-activating protein rickA isoform X2 [Aplysia californica]|uniref:Arp2/3 complex-activating protein rickA isoform X2 n=1 Tax=Aplysia californica TaxID=6500 RepID=A0ABM0K765_APLCA|nr:arp2/3 complex-activating protein rickA isoform X2 [Aplysia californica]